MQKRRRLKAWLSIPCSETRSCRRVLRYFPLKGPLAPRFRANYGVGPEGDIDHKINFQVTSDNKVGIDAGSDSKTFPTLDVYRYSMDEKGNVTVQPLIQQNEKDIGDLTKPKEQLPVVAPK
jgi:hypothetical protein